jgi:hypothetical protein
VGGAATVIASRAQTPPSAAGDHPSDADIAQPVRAHGGVQSTPNVALEDLGKEIPRRIRQVVQQFGTFLPDAVLALEHASPGNENGIIRSLPRSRRCHRRSVCW